MTLLISPKNSLMNQSHHARESDMTVNGDGFGIGWYNTAVRKEPALFRSIRPAWNDENLRYNASMIRTHCLLAHIRAATQGSVSMENTHPFPIQGIFNDAKWRHSPIQQDQAQNYLPIRRRSVSMD
jgi:glutamine amidotransferase